MGITPLDHAERHTDDRSFLIIKTFLFRGIREQDKGPIRHMLPEGRLHHIN